MWRTRRSTIYHLGKDHGLVLLAYAALSLALSWPVARDFTTKLAGDGGDARHNLWVLWHWQQAVLGHQPLFDAPLLYYPRGISLLTHAVGPVEGLFALPFWALGPEAAYNGALLVGLCLTGYGMYLLARGLDFEKDVAFFAGVLLMTSDMSLEGIRGHIEKTFVGLLPLVLLSAHRAFNGRTERGWGVPTGLLLLLTLLHSGWQFTLAVLSVVYFWLYAWLIAKNDQRHLLLRRGAVLAVSALILVGPLLLAIIITASNPALAVASNLQSFNYQPDLVEFFLPSRHSLLFGQQTIGFLQSYQIDFSIETAVSLGYAGLLLCLLAAARGPQRARGWLWLMLLGVLFALGPSLKVLGQRAFTEYRMPLILPYALLTALPGLDFMRTPGQFMLLGFVAFSVTAAFGLSWLIDRAPGWRCPLVALAVILVLVENWPHLWRQEDFPPVPPFYRQIAHDRDIYGVFDLPIQLRPTSTAVDESAHYQMYQIVHHKGIAAGYLSRTYAKPPVFPCLFEHVIPLDVQVDGRPVDCRVNAQYALAAHGYRYVVWHKPRDEDREYHPGSWGDRMARAFVQTAFGQQAPLVADEWVRVFAVAPRIETSGLVTSITLGNHWHEREHGWRWAASPATLYIISPRPQVAWLQITPYFIYDRTAARREAQRGVLQVQVGCAPLPLVSIAADQMAMAPLRLSSGQQTITLTLQAGNFRPLDYGERDPRWLSFAIRSVNLQTIDTPEVPPPVTTEPGC